jgi:hypothetical protein
MEWRVVTLVQAVQTVLGRGKGIRATAGRHKLPGGVSVQVTT